MAIRVHIGSRLIESIDHCNTLQTDHLSAARHATRVHCIASRNHVHFQCNYRTSARVVFRQKIHSRMHWRRESGRGGEGLCQWIAVKCLTQISHTS